MQNANTGPAESGKEPILQSRGRRLIPGQGTRIPQAAKQLSPHTTATESASDDVRVHALQQKDPTRQLIRWQARC